MSPLDCASVRARFEGGDRPLSDEVTQHAAACAACAELTADDGRLGWALGAAARAPGDGAPPDAGALRTAMAHDRSAVGRLKSLSTSARIALANAAVIAVAGAVLVAVARPDLDVYPLGQMAVLVTLHAVVVALALRASLRGLHVGPLPESRRLAILAAAVALPLVAALLPSAHEAHPGSVDAGGASLVPRALECFLFGVVLALPLLLLLAVLDRGGARTPTRFALAGAAAGGAGALALQLHCPIVHPTHLVLGHATVTVAMILLYVAARRLLRSEE